MQEFGGVGGFALDAEQNVEGGGAGEGDRHRLRLYEKRLTTEGHRGNTSSATGVLTKSADDAKGGCVHRVSAASGAGFFSLISRRVWGGSLGGRLGRECAFFLLAEARVTPTRCCGRSPLPGDLSWYGVRLGEESPELGGL